MNTWTTKAIVRCVSCPATTPGRVTADEESGSLRVRIEPHNLAWRELTYTPGDWACPACAEGQRAEPREGT
jgi:hypothetical protein